jgi:hypothetical protein
MYIYYFIQKYQIFIFVYFKVKVNSTFSQNFQLNVEIERANHMLR